MAATLCRCKYSECSDGSPFGTCKLSPGGACFTYMEEIVDIGGFRRSLEKRFGCFKTDEAILQCRGYLSKHYIRKNISCCNSNDYCNDNLMLDIIDGEVVFEEPIPAKFENENLLVYVSLAILFVMSIIILMVLFIKKFGKYKKFKDEKLKESTKTVDDFNSLLQSSSPSIKFDSNIDSEIEIHNNNTNIYSSMYKTLSNSTMSSNDSSARGTTDQHISFLSSVASNSSLMSENTQQSILSSLKTTLQHYNDDSITSGSGSGVPRLVQKTIAKEIEIKSCIGKGRFGMVLHGIRQCEHCAIKIFFSRHEELWRREVKIFEKTIIRHDNIVTFYGADIVSTSGCTQLWLVTQYHELGSLFDYLKLRPITSITQMLNIMKSIIFGLSHLHTEINGHREMGKPIIAHRDIKSTNILMKSDNCCCISDFACAITSKDSPDLYKNSRMGTIRYMAPELLNETINANNINEYIYADIYSLGLVYWEIFNRLKIENGNGNYVKEYEKPYKEYVSDQPTFEEMEKIVVHCKLRPQFDYSIIDNNNNQILLKIIRLIQECWSHNPNARLTSLRIKKTILDISLMQQQEYTR